MDTLARFRGCLLAGAVGDGLGEGVEFLSLSEIRRRGVDETRLRITDDTQMTLFTAEGLIRASVRTRVRGDGEEAAATVHRAYLRWLATQSPPVRDGDGWLVAESLLQVARAPGTTCLSALRSGRMGSPTHRLNDSKGCGGVMRVAPVGLFCEDPATAFDLAVDLAAITHGHPSGYLPAGVLAATVAGVLGDADLPAALDGATRLLHGREGAGETVAALKRATALAAGGLPEPEQIESLGGGWVGEEALAIAVACALAAVDLRAALLAAVTHSGDSDSTGAICGNLLGAAWGADAIPQPWLDGLQEHAVVDRMAHDLWTERYEPAEWGPRYPPS